MNKATVFGGILLFLLGVVIGTAFSHDSARYAFSNTAEPVISPSDSIGQNNLHLFNDRLVIEEQGLSYASIKDTHSMEPVLNSHSTSIEKKPTTPDVLAAGDIISYQQDSLFIIHRIIKTGYDTEGWFAITQGDNNNYPDANKVRFDEVEGKVVGILY